MRTDALRLVGSATEASRAVRSRHGLDGRVSSASAQSQKRPDSVVTEDGERQKQQQHERQVMQAQHLMSQLTCRARLARKRMSGGDFNG
jgi:hypothetical protein